VAHEPRFCLGISPCQGPPCCPRPKQLSLSGRGRRVRKVILSRFAEIFAELEIIFIVSIYDELFIMRILPVSFGGNCNTRSTGRCGFHYIPYICASSDDEPLTRVVLAKVQILHVLDPSFCIHVTLPRLRACIPTDATLNPPLSTAMEVYILPLLSHCA
jgi:hypothetical protein